MKTLTKITKQFFAISLFYALFTSYSTAMVPNLKENCLHSLISKETLEYFKNDPEHLNELYRLPIDVQETIKYHLIPHLGYKITQIIKDSLYDITTYQISYNAKTILCISDTKEIIEVWKKNQDNIYHKIQIMENPENHIRSIATSSNTETITYKLDNRTVVIQQPRFKNITIHQALFI